MITSKTQYEKVMHQLDLLMSKRSKAITPEEAEVIKLLAGAAQQYEQKIVKIKEPASLQGILEMLMFELKMNQKEFASYLGISETKISFVLNGKRKADIDLLKLLHSKLTLDAAVLLQAA